MSQKTKVRETSSQETVTMDLRSLLMKMISYWWLYALCLGISIGFGYFYLRYATYQYSARAVLLIKDAGRSGNISEQNVLFTDQPISLGSKTMDNEIQILKSLTLMEKVVDQLDINVQYFRLGNVKETELYKETPILLDTFKLAEGRRFATFLIELDNYESFLLRRFDDEKPGEKFYFNVPFETEEGMFQINLNPLKAVVQGNYRLSVSPIENVAFRYKSRINPVRIGDQNRSSVLELSLLDPVAEKASDILNTLIEVYNKEEVLDENTVLRNTIEFIDHRVAQLVMELDSVEGGIERYKSSNAIISGDASTSLNYTLDEIRSYIKEISEYDIQKDLLESLERLLLIEKTGFDLIPTNLIAKTPVLSSLVLQYNDLIIQQNKLASTASEINPVRQNIERQLVDLRNLILETIQNLKNDIQIPIAQIEDNIQDLRRSMSSIPGIEKKLIEQIRTQEVKENLFLYLLQKREETALAEAVTTAKTRMIDYARTPSFPIYPRRNFTYMVSGLLGLFVPTLIVLLAMLLDNKVDSEETIKQLTDIPILGRIAYQKGNKKIVVKRKSRSAVNEMFRALRTNLNFVNSGTQTQTLLVTSSISGEGKTFIALNLGITLALSGKKVVVLGLDLRRPQLSNYIQSSQKSGITDYLVGQKSLDQILQVYDEVPELNYITSGPIPPNPAELIMSQTTTNLLTELKERFDYIIIDTPPIGLVSDALLLRDQINNILIIVQHRYTRKGMIRNLENMRAKNELPKANIIFNGIKYNKTYARYSSYGGYHYGEKKGYYVED